MRNYRNPSQTSIDYRTFFHLLRIRKVEIRTRHSWGEKLRIKVWPTVICPYHYRIFVSWVQSLRSSVFVACNIRRCSWHHWWGYQSIILPYPPIRSSSIRINEWRDTILRWTKELRYCSRSWTRFWTRWGEIRSRDRTMQTRQHSNEHCALRSKKLKKIEKVLFLQVIIRNFSFDPVPNVFHHFA